MRDSAHSPLNKKRPPACGLKAEAGHNRPRACRGRARGKTVAQPLRGVCRARVARHATCAAWTLRDSARQDGERKKQPVADRRKVPWQARMHGRARRSGYNVGRERSERPTARGMRAAAPPPNGRGQGGRGQDTPCAKARKYPRQARMHARYPVGVICARVATTAQSKSARQTEAARRGRGLVTSAEPRPGHAHSVSVARLGHDGGRQRPRASDRRVASADGSRPFFGAQGREADRDGRRERGRRCWSGAAAGRRQRRRTRSAGLRGGRQRTRAP